MPCGLSARRCFDEGGGVMRVDPRVSKAAVPARLAVSESSGPARTLTTMTRPEHLNPPSPAPGCCGPPASWPSPSPAWPAPRRPAVSTAPSLRCSAARSPGSSSAPDRHWSAASPRPSPVDPGDRRGHGTRAPPRRRGRRLRHLAGRPGPDGRPHRSPPRSRPGPCPAAAVPPALAVGRRHARPVGAGLDRHHPRPDPCRAAVHHLRCLRCDDVLSTVRPPAPPSCFPTVRLPTRPPSRSRIEATA